MQSVADSRDRSSVIKKSMHRLMQMDNDIASRYDDDDDHLPVPKYLLQGKRNARERFIKLTDRFFDGKSRKKGQLNAAIANIKQQQQFPNRKIRQAQMSAGGVSSSAQPIIMSLVKVIRGASMGREFILKAIAQYVDDVKPILLKSDKSDIVFFVESEEVASAIQALSRRIYHPVSSMPVTIVTKKLPVGFSAICLSDVQEIKEVLQKRYSEERHLLDIGGFALDPAFRSKSLAMSLCKSNVMMTVVELIDSNFGSITSLCLKGNRLRFLDHLACLIYRIRNLQELDLSNNQIENVQELSKLKGWNLTTLYIENNPMCSKFSSVDSYLSAIHNVFPEVTLLDGIPVQKASSLPDLGGDREAPAPKSSYIGNVECASLVEEFVSQYFTLYDSDDTNNRKQLIEAYEENATFSLSMENIPDANNARPSFEYSLYNTYRKVSHNIMHISKWEHCREKVIQKGGLEIVVQLRKLPATKHLIETFIVDIALAQGDILCLNLMGFFHDRFSSRSELNDANLKFFSRNFVLVKKGERKLAILSDMLFLSGVFKERLQRYKLMQGNMLKATSVESRATNTQPIPIEEPSATTSHSANAQTPVQMAADGNLEIQHLMIETFSRESGMKPEWSRKCLTDQNWDYERAGRVFLAVRQQIPPDAFR